MEKVYVGKCRKPDTEVGSYSVIFYDSYVIAENEDEARSKLENKLSKENKNVQASREHILDEVKKFSIDGRDIGPISK